jgi:hypothetical protein
MQSISFCHSYFVAGAMEQTPGFEWPNARWPAVFRICGAANRLLFRRRKFDLLAPRRDPRSVERPLQAGARVD